MFNRILLADATEAGQGELFARLKITVGEGAGYRGYYSRLGLGSCEVLEGQLQVLNPLATNYLEAFYEYAGSSFIIVNNQQWAEDPACSVPRRVENEKTGTVFRLVKPSDNLFAIIDDIFNGVATGEECIIAIYA